MTWLDRYVAPAAPPSTPPSPEVEEEKEKKPSSWLARYVAPEPTKTPDPGVTTEGEEIVAQEPTSAVQRQEYQPSREYVPSSSLVRPRPTNPHEQVANALGRVGRDLVQGVEGVNRTVSGAVQGTGQAIGQLGETAASNWWTQPFAGALQGLGGEVEALGEGARLPVQPALPEGEKRTLETAFTPREGETSLVDDVLRAAPSFAAGIAAFAYGGPTMAQAALGAQEFGGQYERAKSENRSDEEALLSAVLYAPASALLETWGTGKVIEKAFPGASKRAALDFVKRWTESFLAEGSTESTQDVASNLSALVAGAAERGISFDDLAEVFSEENLRQYGRTALVGGILGQAPVVGMAALSRPAAETVTSEEARKVTEPPAPSEGGAPPSPPVPEETSQPREGERLGRGLSEGAIDSWIERLGPGPAGLSRQDVDGALSVVYRDPKGKAVSAAVLSPDGKATDLLFTDKRRGALGARAAVAVGRDLQSMGVTEARGEISQEAVQARKRLEQQGEAPETLATPPVRSGPGEAGFMRVGATAEAQLPPFEFIDEDTESRYREATRGARKAPFLTRLREGAQTLGHAFSREHGAIPHGEFHAPVRESLRRVSAAPAVSTDRVAIALHNNLSNLSDPDYDLFLRSTLVDNLRGIRERYGEEVELGFGFTDESLASEGAKIDEAVAQSPRVAEARERMADLWNEIREEVRPAYEAVGVPTDFLDAQGESYLHHQILEYAQRERQGVGGQLRTPTGRGFQRRLQGSEKDFNLRYALAQGQVMSQLLTDAEIARQLRTIDQQYSEPVVSEAKKAAKAANESLPEGAERRSWKEFLPEGYVVWQPQPGNHFFMGKSLQQRVADSIIEKGVAEVAEQDLRDLLMVGGRRREMALPAEIAETLDATGRRIDNEVLRKIVRGNEALQRGWKVWQLLSPRRQFKYLTRNFVGDAAKVFSGNPSTFTGGNVPTAWRELRQVLYKKRREAPPELAGWLARGGLSSGLFQQEIEQSEAERLDRLMARPGAEASFRDAAKAPGRAVRGYWRVTRTNAKMLESLLRYATYRDYLRQIQKSPDGKPRNYGASNPSEVDALLTPEDKAYWLANELVGAYDMVSEGGQFLRREIMPFWSFQELNVRSHYRLLRNALRDERVAQAFARRAGITAARYGTMSATRAGKFLALAYALEAMLHAWNYGRYPDEERELPESVRRSPHVVLGRRKNGEIRYFNRLGVFGEFREWFGIDEFGLGVVEYLNGRMSPKEVAVEMATPVVDKSVSMIGGFGYAGTTKQLLEALTRTSTFPSATRPSRISDVPDHLARSLGVENEFRVATGRPMPTGGKTPGERFLRSIPQAFLYSQDPGAAAYYDTLNLRDRYLRHIGAERSGYGWSARSNALRNYKRALRYDEPDLAEKYLYEYAMAGGTPEGLDQSLRHLDPLYGLKDEEEEGFINWLTEEEKKRVERAKTYYESVLLREQGMPFDEDAVFLRAELDRQKKEATR